MSDVTKLTDVLAGKDNKPMSRVVYAYKIPKDIANPFYEVELRELNAAEQITLSKMMPDDATNEEQMDGMVRMSLFTLDGKPVDITRAEFELMWNKVHPRVLRMIRKEVNKILVPSPKEEEDFLSSRTVRVIG